MKRIMKTIGLVILCILGIVILLVGALTIKNKVNMKKSWLPDDYYTQFHYEMPLEKKYIGLGNYEVRKTVHKSDDKTIENIRIWYPAKMETEKTRYPMIIAVNGSNTAALNYEAFFSRLASWGFIVVGNDDRQSGTGASTSATLDYMLKLNSNSSSEFFGKIDETNIGCVGYSQGGAGAIRAVTEFDNSNKFTCLFTGSAAYSLLAGNMGWGYDVSKINIPYFMTAGTGTSDDAGNNEIHNNEVFAGVAPLASLIENYEKIFEDVIKVRARVTGAEHGDMQVKTDSYMTAWMLYHLQNDEEAKTVFYGEDAEILNNSNWQDVEKNQ